MDIEDLQKAARILNSIGKVLAKSRLAFDVLSDEKTELCFDDRIDMTEEDEDELDQWLDALPNEDRR